MTDNEIIKALECCGTGCGNCYVCPYDVETCITTEGETLLMKDALDLINSQKAEIERLKKDLMKCKLEKEMLHQVATEIQTVAIKEFADRLKRKYESVDGQYIDRVLNTDIDNLVKEMTEVRKRTESDGKWVKDIEGYIIDTENYRSSVFIPLNEVTNTLLFAIFSNKPRAIMGGVIEDYQDKVVPNIIQALKKVAPEIHKKFIAEYPQFDVAPNYVGKYAFIKTMVNGSKLEDAHGNVFVLDNGKLICEKWRLSFVPFQGGTAKMEIVVRDDMEYKITSNDQCDENTKFA